MRIGILIVVEENLDFREYQEAFKSFECYAKLHNYGFQIIIANGFWKFQCRNRDVSFCFTFAVT